MNKYKKIFLVFLLLTCIMLVISCSNANKKYISTLQNTKDMKIHYIDVGQGDATLLQVNGRSLLIDAGPNVSSNKLIKYLKSLNIHTLDYVIATHPDEDHIGGMDDIIKNFDVKAFYAPKKTSTTLTFQSMIKALRSKNLKILVARANTNMNIDLGLNTKCSILSPIDAKYDTDNNYSVVFRVEFGEKSFLFMGDAEKKVESELIRDRVYLKSDVLKVGHHGSSSSTSEEFLQEVSPSIAIISCGAGNKYGHPHKATLEELEKNNITIYRTDEDGNIVLITDGKSIKRSS